jgi:hypothetical protein
MILTSNMIDPKEIIYQPIPHDKIARLRRFARDLAWFFVNDFIEDISLNEGFLVRSEDYNHSQLLDYIDRVWLSDYPSLSLLGTLGYIKYNRTFSEDKYYQIGLYDITEKAILLLEETPPASIFISYSRAESSALALLIVARLKEHGLSAFLDMHPDREGLAVGDDWHAKLEEVVASNNNFIVLIGQQTLNSRYVRQEIEWAYKNHKAIFPVWHKGFKGLNQENSSYEITEAIQYVIGTVNATIVEAENPKQYNAALDELLSSFGIVP